MTIDSNKNIVIKSTNNEQFKLLKCGNDIKRMLGFTQSVYEDDIEYIAEDKCSLDSRVYLFLEGIDIKPFAELDLSSDIHKTHRKMFNKKPLDKLDSFAIKFKKNNITDNEEMYNFDNKPHELNFRIATLD